MPRSRLVQSPQATQQATLYGPERTEKVRRYSKMGFVAGPEVENVLKSQVP